MAAVMVSRWTSRIIQGCIVCATVAWLCVTPARAATVEFWHPWTHVAKRISALASAYSSRGATKIHVRVFSPTSYKPWTSREQPDLVGLYRPTKRDVEDLVKAGRVRDLNPEISRGWYWAFLSGMLETFTIRVGGRGGVYGVPLTGQVHVFVYNKTLFKKAGISRPPYTWSELMIDAQRLRRIGVIPYAGGFGSDTPPLAMVYEWSYLGLYMLTETYFGRHPYTSPEWIKYLSLYSEMRRYRFTDAASASMSTASAIKALLDGRVAIVLTDTSFESIRASYKPRFTAWGLFRAPVDWRAPYLPRLPAGTVEGVVVNSRSARKTEAIAFLKWLTEPDQQIALANDARSIPATSRAVSSMRLRDNLRVFASMGMGDMMIDLRVYEQPRVLQAFYAGVRGLLAGSGTPASVARKAQAARKR